MPGFLYGITFWFKYVLGIISSNNDKCLANLKVYDMKYIQFAKDRSDLTSQLKRKIIASRLY